MASSLTGGVNAAGLPQHQHPQQHHQHQQHYRRHGSPLADQFSFGGSSGGSPSSASSLRGVVVGAAAPETSTPHVAGVVSVVDVTSVEEEKFGVLPETSSDQLRGLVAHFMAHINEPLASMAWNQSGQLLFTADRLGHDFNVFKVRTVL